MPYLYGILGVYALCTCASTMNKQLKASWFDIPALFALRTRSEYAVDIEQLNIQVLKKSGKKSKGTSVGRVDAHRLDSLQDVAALTCERQDTSQLDASIFLCGMKLMLAMQNVTDAVLSKSETTTFTDWMTGVAQDIATGDQNVNITDIATDDLPADCDALRMMMYTLAKILPDITTEFRGIIKNDFTLPGISPRLSHNNMLLNIDLSTGYEPKPNDAKQRGGAPNTKGRAQAKPPATDKAKGTPPQPRTWTFRDYCNTFVPTMKAREWPKYVCVRVQRKAGQSFIFHSEEMDQTGQSYTVFAVILATKAIENITANSIVAPQKCIHDTVYLRAADDEVGDSFYKYEFGTDDKDYLLRRVDTRRHVPDFANDAQFRKHVIGLIYSRQ
jgi:hypothetical protein